MQILLKKKIKFVVKQYKVYINFKKLQAIKK